MTAPAFPTSEHSAAAAAVVEFFSREPVEAVLLVNSCARGVAVPESDIDFAILVDPALPEARRARMEQRWKAHGQEHPTLRRFVTRSHFASIHLDIFDGDLQPTRWDDGGGPDAFEIEIGNRIRHGAPLWEHGAAFTDLRSRWLPYYGEVLRAERLGMVEEACRLNLDRVRGAVGRGLLFYGVDRLHHAFGEFLQGVFIARRTYPIAYNKWIREQVVDWLGLPDLYEQLPFVFELARLDEPHLMAATDHVAGLLGTWLSQPLPAAAVPPARPAPQTRGHHETS